VPGLALFDAALLAPSAYQLAARIDRSALRAAEWLPPVLRGLFRPTRPRTAAPATAVRSVADQLASLPEAEAYRVLLDLVRGSAAAVLGHSSPELVRPARPFKEIGFDSLTGVELRNRLMTSTGLRLPAALVFDHPTPEALARHLVARTAADRPAAAASVLSEWDRLEALWTGLPPDTGIREQLAQRLRQALTRLEPGAEPGPALSPDRIEAATDDEVFAYIDRQLGIS